MRDTAIMLIGIIFLIGLSVIVGFIFRNTDDGEDKDNILMTLFRGLGVLIAFSGPLIVVIGILYWIFSD